MTDNVSHPDDGPEQDDAIIGRALIVSLAVFLVLGIVAAGIVGAYLFSVAPPPPQPTGQVAAAGKRESAVASVPKVPLTDVTAESGIHFTHANGAYGEKLLP